MANIRSHIDYWAGVAYDPIRPKPHWTVTWPTLPGGIYTIGIRRATGVEDAIKQARAGDNPTAPGYRIDYGATPSVWQVKPGPARRVFGPNYGEDA